MEINDIAGNTDMSVVMAAHGIGILSTTSAIDFKTFGTTTLYTVPTGKKALITGVMIEATSASGVSAVATGGIGTNVGEDNILASIGFTGLDATGKAYFHNVSGSRIITNAGEVIKAGIDIAAIATGALTCKIYLLGILLDV